MLDREKEVDIVLDAFNQVVSQDYADFLSEENLKHTELLFDSFYAGATSGLAFIKEWNTNARRNK